MLLPDKGIVNGKHRDIYSLNDNHKNDSKLSKNKFKIILYMNKGDPNIGNQPIENFLGNGPTRNL